MMMLKAIPKGDFCVSTKERVAAELEKHRGQPLSGQELADLLGVSRTAVWKAVNALKEEGWRISGVRNLGYAIEADTDVLTAEGIRRCLPERYKALPVEVYKSVESTNTAARTAALAESSPLIIAADEQTAGRGRYGKPFYSPKMTGLYMSVMLKPNKPLSDCFYITAAAACAITSSIEEVCGISAGIKWVNDIFYKGRKVCGILTEAISDFESGMVDTVIVGIGLNIRTQKFPEELSGVAGSLGVFAERSRLCAEIAARLLDYVDGGDSALMEEYRRRSVLIGREVRYYKGSEEYTGVVQEIDDRGRIVIDGKAYCAGEIAVSFN